MDVAGTLDPPPAADPPPIDPRIRARRIAVAARRRAAGASGAVVDVARRWPWSPGFVVALRSPLLDVDARRRSPAPSTRTGRRGRRARPGIAPGDPLIDVDLRRRAARGRGAAVGRRRPRCTAAWPAPSRSHVTERTAVAVVGDGRGGRARRRRGPGRSAPAADDPAGAAALVRDRRRRAPARARASVLGAAAADGARGGRPPGRARRASGCSSRVERRPVAGRARRRAIAVALRRRQPARRQGAVAAHRARPGRPHAARP